MVPATGRLPWPEDRNCPLASATQQPMPATVKSGPESSRTDVRLLPLLPLLYFTAVPAAQPFELCP